MAGKSSGAKDMTDEEYFATLGDYEQIKEYLEESRGLEPPKQQPFEPHFGSSIVVDNLPMIPDAKVPKLLSALVKIYSQASASLQESDIFMPFDNEASTTSGFCFITFKTEDDAKLAIQLTQGYKLDKQHCFRVTPFSDLEKYQKLPDVYVTPEPPVFKPRPDPTCYLVDLHCRDQFVTRHGPNTEISWANLTGEEPEKVYGGEREKEENKVWCDSYVFWSPQGTYLATFHKQGVKLWGGQDFQAQGRFSHNGVEVIDFSPCERYLITYRYTQDVQYDPAKSIIVWDVRTGAELRSFELKNPLDPKFQVQAHVWVGDDAKRTQRVVRGRVVSYEWNDARGVGEFTIEEGNNIHKEIAHDSDAKVTPMMEPNRLKWSPDGSYVARLGCDIITVYDVPSMAILDKKSLAAKDVLEFAWCPSVNRNVLSYWSPAVGNHPALISVVSLPDRKEVCSRKLFDVLDGKMVWQNDGDYLCVHMTKVTGKKRSHVLMFFRIKDAEVPVEQLEVVDQVLSVAWEPFGDRVAIVTGEARNPTISFYSMAGASTSAAEAKAKAPPGAPPSYAAKLGQVANKKELALLFTVTGTQATEVLWSPAGNIAALVFQAPEACIFELYDVENNTQLAQRKHERANRLVWDPSGRIVASCTISDMRHDRARGHAEDGFVLYSFQGNPIISVRREKLYQFMWRPRPKDLIPSDEKKKIIKNLKKYEKIFEKEDRQRKQELNAEVAKARLMAAQVFATRLLRNRELNAGLKAQLVAARGGYDESDDRNYDVITNIKETVISTKETVLGQ